MVSAEKHRALLKDTKTRFTKQVIRQQLISKNSQKKEKLGNKWLYTNGGTAGINSINETEIKRAKANESFIRMIKED